MWTKKEKKSLKSKLRLTTTSNSIWRIPKLKPSKANLIAKFLLWIKFLTNIFLIVSKKLYFTKDNSNAKEFFVLLIGKISENARAF